MVSGSEQTSGVIGSEQTSGVSGSEQTSGVSGSELPVLKGKRIVVTGPAGQIAFAICRHLAADNEVWGVARFSNPDDRARCEAIGVRTVVADLGSGDLSAAPADVDYVLHLAAAQGPGDDFEPAIVTNAEGTGLALQYWREAAAVLVMSTHSVYRPHPDPLYVFHERSPLGDTRQPYSPAYSVSKLMQEGVARAAARMLGVPVVIARMNAAYDATGGLPVLHLRALAEGRTVTTRFGPCPYQPIHSSDIARQVAPLLSLASVPATIVNWAGDEVVSPQEWVPYMAELAGLEPRLEVVEVPGTLRGSIADVSLRASVTGPCRVGWREGLAEAVHYLTAGGPV